MINRYKIMKLNNIFKIAGLSSMLLIGSTGVKIF